MKQAIIHNAQNPQMFHAGSAAVGGAFLRFILVAGLVSFPLSALTQCGKAPQKQEVGKIIHISGGKATIERKKGDTVKTIKAEKGTVLRDGDVVVTSEAAVALLKFKDKGDKKASVETEIQGSSRFAIEEFTPQKKGFFLEKGNAWFFTRKKKNQAVSLRTPTTVAGVRGTKFFTFTLPNGLQGTCHCEGEVAYQADGGEYEATHKEDAIVFHRNGKTVLLTPKDLAFLGTAAHHHSVIKDSPLGPLNDLSPKLIKKMMKLVDKKFAAKNKG